MCVNGEILFCVQDQYMFIHDVLVEYLSGGGQTAVAYDNIVNYVAFLTSTANGATPHDDKKIHHSVNTLENQYKVWQSNALCFGCKLQCFDNRMMMMMMMMMTMMMMIMMMRMTRKTDNDNFWWMMTTTTMIRSLHIYIGDDDFDGNKK
jgi:hypothetical protein